MRKRTRVFVGLLVLSVVANTLLLAYVLFIDESDIWKVFKGFLDSVEGSFGNSQLFTYWIPGSAAALFFILFLLNAISIVKNGDRDRGFFSLMTDIFTSKKESAIVCVAALTVLSIQWNVDRTRELPEDYISGIVAIETLLVTAGTITDELDELYRENIVDRVRSSTVDLQRLATRVPELDERIRALTKELADLIEITDDLADRVDDSVDNVKAFDESLIDFDGRLSRLDVRLRALYNLHPLQRRLSPEGD